MTVMDTVAGMIRDAEIVPEHAEQQAAEKELADARQVLAALTDRPDWARQPGELDQAYNLIHELEQALPAVQARVHEARQARRHAAYGPAMDAINAEWAELAEEAPGLVDAHRAAVGELSRVLDLLEKHHTRREAAVRAGRTLRDFAEQHREAELLPARTEVGAVPVPDPRHFERATRPVRKMIGGRSWR